ncbi:RiPP maturation radical SAM C-methyltransferase [Polymorphobacter sp.]|uniref:RiPP maturation radical SAM C-methyltransferase n=1 Tax=Polymorphobacter sp. TaxID=1909290 RepID=UPI003F70DF96
MLKTLPDTGHHTGLDAALGPVPRAAPRRPRLALVFPPFGPSGMPSLGLGLLSARVKASGHSCKTFYWSFEMLQHLAPPGEDWPLEKQLGVYDALTQRSLYPLNEWLFTGALYDFRPELTAEGRRRLALFSAGEMAAASGGRFDAAFLAGLHDRMPALIEDFADRLANHDIIGISTTFYQNVAALALARHIKMRWPEKKVILGGANVDGVMGPALFELFPFLDHILQGEVDHGLVALINAHGDETMLAQIPGLLFRPHAGAPAQRGPASVPESRLAALPTPDYADYLETLDRLGISEARDLTLALETSRGCWWGAKSHCTFCGLNANGIGYRTKDADRALAEIEEICTAHRPRFLFMTDNIIALPHFETLLPALAARPDGPQIFYEIKSNMDREKIRRLAAARVSAVQPGIESFSTSILKLMRKGVSAAQNVALLKYARDYGIRPAYNIILNFPGENPADYDDVIEQMPKLWHLMPPSSAPMIEFHRFSPYHADPASFGITLEPNPHYRLLYPDAGPRLADIAYSFVRSDPGARQGPPPYLERLAVALRHWHQQSDWLAPQLWWEDGGDHVRVHDHRGGSASVIELHGFAAALLHRLDSPQSLPALLRSPDPESSDASADAGFFAAMARGHRAIAFTADMFRAEPHACLGLFAEAGLIFTDANAGGEPLYVALPLRPDTPPMSMEWTDAYI